MASPTAVNIGIGFDIKEVMQNTGLARNEIARFTRDVKTSLTDAEKFARDANVANVLFQKGQIDEATHQKMIAMYRERYKVIDEVAAREAQQQAHQRARLDEYAAHKQAMAKREEDSALFMMNLRKQMEVAESEAAKKKAEQIATARKAEEDAVIFLMNLRKQGQLMEEEAAKKKAEQIASARKSEEDGIVFLMNIRKQMQLAEEEAAKKKAEQIAAAKKSEEESIIFMMNLRKQIQLAEEEAAKKKAEQIATARKAEEDAMMFMHRLKQTIDADNKARQQETLNKILAQQQQEIQGILRIEQSRQQASKLLLDSINNERQATQQAAEAEKNARWDTINFLIKSEADLAEQKRKRNQEELAAQEKLKQNAIDSMKSQANLGINMQSVATAQKSVAQATQDTLTAEQMLLGVTQKQAESMRSASEAARVRALGTHDAHVAAFNMNNQIRSEDETARANNLARVRSLLDATTTAQERYAQTLRFVQNMERWGNITREEAIRIINAQRDAILQLTQAEESARRSQTFVGQFIAGLGITTGPMLAAQAILQVVEAMKSFVRESVVLAAEYQRTEAAMKALTGSTAEAAKKMIEFRELDKKTPLSFLDFAKGAKTLMGFGLEAERTGAIMTSLSAISMGNAERFQSLALAFGQVRASGKLAGQEVLQMVNAGFNPLQEIAKLTGESMAELRQKTTDGQISFEEVALAIELATEAGGRFATMNEELQQTLAGQYDKHISDLKMMQIELGENLMPLMVQLLGVVKDLTNANNQAADSYNYIRTATGSLALIVAIMRDIANIQYTVEKSAFNLIFNPLQAVKDWRALKDNNPVKEVLDQINEAQKEREFQEGMAKRKREEDAAKEQERAKKRLELGEEGYRQWRLNEARKETQTRNAEKQAEEKAKNELDAIEKTRQEFERLGKTKRELYMESIGFNAPGISVAEQAKRQESLKEFDAIEAHKKEEEAIKKKVRALVEEKNEVELLELAKRRKITQDELADAKNAIFEKHNEEFRKREEKKQQDQIQRLVKENDLLGLRNLLAQKKIDQDKFDEAKQKIEDNVKSIQERFNPAVKYKNDLQEIKNLLAAGLIDQQTADKAGAALAKSVMGNIQQYQAPTRVGSMGDAMLAAQRASMTDKHQKMVEKYLKEIADKIAKNPGLIANFNP